MAEERSELSWRQLLPWTELFRAFQVALDLNKLLLAAAGIFLGAFLLFALEPLIAKIILPWFGGTAGVWIACLLFFQAALLAGYTYAHLLTRKLAAAQQWRLHAGRGKTPHARVPCPVQ